MPEFRDMTFGELERHLEGRWFAVNISDTWAELVEAAELDWHTEEGC